MSKSEKRVETKDAFVSHIPIKPLKAAKVSIPVVIGNNQSVISIGSIRAAPHFPQNFAELGFSEKSISCILCFNKLTPETISLSQISIAIQAIYDVILQ